MEISGRKIKNSWLARTLWWLFIVGAVLFAVHRGLSDDPKATMHQFLSGFLVIQPYLVSDESFSDPKNKEVITSRLKNLSELAGQAADHFQLQKLQYRFSRKVLKDQFESAYQAYRYGNKQYARDAVNASLSLCMSCHTQLPAKSRPSGFLTKQVEKPVLPEDMFKQADLVFVMWEFDWALALYDQIIAEYPKNKLKSEQIRTALERKLAIWARVKRDPEGAIKSFKKDLENHRLPGYLERNIRGWISEFEKWKAEPKFDVKNAGDDELDRFVTENLVLIEKSGAAEGVDSPHLVAFLKISGVLYEYLTSHENTKLKPEILYWLGLCDKRTNSSFFYSLSDLYLKECIVSYSKNPVARKCFDEYKKNTLAKYLVHYQNKVPAEVQNDLKKLEALVNPLQQ